MRYVTGPTGEVIKCEDLCVAYDHTPRTTAAEVLNNQTNRMTWPVDVSLCPCNGLMNGTIMKAEMEPHSMDSLSPKLI